MALQTQVVRYTYRCDDCGTQVEVASHDPADMPTGYHVHVRRVTAAHHHNASGALFFCTKDCLLHSMRYGLSSLMDPID